MKTNLTKMAKGINALVFTEIKKQNLSDSEKVELLKIVAKRLLDHTHTTSPFNFNDHI